MTERHLRIIFGCSLNNSLANFHGNWNLIFVWRWELKVIVLQPILQTDWPRSGRVFCAPPETGDHVLKVYISWSNGYVNNCRVSFLYSDNHNYCFHRKVHKRTMRNIVYRFGLYEINKILIFYPFKLFISFN